MGGQGNGSTRKWGGGGTSPGIAVDTPLLTSNQIGLTITRLPNITNWQVNLWRAKIQHAFNSAFIMERGYKVMCMGAH